jgi:hypothetical protein
MRKLLLVIGALSVVVVWWQWRIEGQITDSSLGFLNYDLYSYYYPTTCFAFEEAWRGHLALWNPYQLAGQPFFASQQHGLLYPPHLLFLFLPCQLAFKWAAILNYTLAFVFSAYLGRVLRLSTTATLIGALGFTFGGYLQGLLYSRNWLSAAVWLPLEVALTLRLFTEEWVIPPALILAGALACQYFGGFPMHIVFAGYCVGLLALWQALVLLRAGRWRQAARGAAALVIAVVAAGALSALQLLPMVEMAWLSPRRPGALSAFAANPFPGYALHQFATLWMPTDSGRYVGAAVVPLLVAAFFHPRQRSAARFFLALSAIAAAAAISTTTPLYEIYRDVPTATWFRFPAELSYLVTFGLTFAAAIGADTLVAYRPRWSASRLIAPGLLLLIVALAIRLYQPTPPWLWAGRKTAVALFAVALPLLLVAGQLRQPLWILTILAVWLDLSLASANRFVIPDVDPHRFDPPAALTRFLQEHQGHPRVYFHQRSDRPPLPRSEILHRLFNISDQESLTPSRYAEYVAWLQNGTALSGLSLGNVFLDPQRKQMKLLDLLGVRFIVSFGSSPFANAAEAAAYPQVFATDGARVYQNPHVLPRAFVVGTAQQAEAASTLARLSQDDFDARDVALVESSAAVVTDGLSRPAEIREYTPERVAITVHGDAPGLLVLTDQFYPGWRATVDGEAAPIYRADYLFRGVRVPAGEHTVVFRYAPRSFLLGAWVSALTLATITAAGWRARRIRRRAPHHRSQR